MTQVLRGDVVVATQGTAVQSPTTAISVVAIYVKS